MTLGSGPAGRHLLSRDCSAGRATLILQRLHILVQLHLDQRRLLDIFAQRADSPASVSSRPCLLLEALLEPVDVLFRWSSPAVPEPSRGSPSPGWRVARGFPGRTRRQLGVRGLLLPQRLDLRLDLLALLLQVVDLLDVAREARRSAPAAARGLVGAGQLVVAAGPEPPLSRDEDWLKSRLLSAELSMAEL